MRSGSWSQAQGRLWGSITPGSLSFFLSKKFLLKSQRVIGRDREHMLQSTKVSEKSMMYENMQELQNRVAVFKRDSRVLLCLRSPSVKWEQMVSKLWRGLRGGGRLRV